MFNEVHRTSHRQDECALVFQSETTDVAVISGCVAVRQRPQRLDQCARGIIASDRVCRGDIQGGVVRRPNARHIRGKRCATSRSER